MFAIVSVLSSARATVERILSNRPVLLNQSSAEDSRNKFVDVLVRTDHMSTETHTLKIP